MKKRLIIAKFSDGSIMEAPFVPEHERSNPAYQVLLDRFEDEIIKLINIESLGRGQRERNEMKSEAYKVREMILKNTNAALLELPSIANESFIERVVTLANKGYSNEVDDLLHQLEEKYGL